MSTIKKLYAIFRIVKLVVDALSDWHIDEKEAKAINKLLAELK